MKKIIALNWKMAPVSLKEAEQILKIIQDSRYKIQDTRLIICPPFIYLEQLSKALNPKRYTLDLELGAQNISWERKGAYTGEISPLMLKNAGVKYVIIGHSERRKWQDETDEIINKKIKSALKAGLKVILCVGENIQIRKKGLKSIKTFIKNQLQKDLKGLKAKSSKLKANLMIAYEPIWAIGTGNFCKPEDALEIIKFIKKVLKAKSSKLKAKVLYGGSVNSKNILSFLKYDDSSRIKEIDGVLVGSASVNIKELKKILSLLQ